MGDELWWAYCVMRASDPWAHGIEGVRAGVALEREQSGALAAVISAVPREEFAADPLRRSLNDLKWLERVARAHETVLDQLLGTGTIVPLRICTIYESREHVGEMLERERSALSRALDALTDRQEWGVKVLADRAKLTEAVAGDRKLSGELVAAGSGSAYLARRRLEREAREAASSLAIETARQVHACLAGEAIDAVTRPPQNRELSGHEGEMLLNSAYLVDAGRVNELRATVSELEAGHSQLGVRIELTGPWPPFNFVPGGADPASA